MEPEYAFDHVTYNQAVWSTAGFIAAITVAAMTVVIVMVARRFDRTGGMLTISILVVQGFITGVYGAMLYEIRQNPITEILVGALATSMGAVIAHWVGGTRAHTPPDLADKGDPHGNGMGQGAGGADHGAPDHH